MELTFLSPKKLTEEVKESKGMQDRTIERMNKQACHQELNSFSYFVYQKEFPQCTMEFINKRFPSCESHRAGNKLSVLLNKKLKENEGKFLKMQSCFLGKLQTLTLSNKNGKSKKNKIIL